jgi:EmrB/QacA subfamily drug resistance transporter
MMTLGKTFSVSDWKQRMSPMFLPLIVGCALFMQMLDSTVIATALPSMAHSFGESPVRLNLAITSYLLSAAVFVPICGWASDRFGARRVFASAIFLFTLSSVLCGCAQTLTQLVGGRLLQGFAGAMMVPVGRIVLLRTVKKSELVRAMSFLSMPALMGPIFGPAVGGFIVTYSSWRWIFFINVPIGCVGVYLVVKYIKDLEARSTEPLDVTGFLLTGICLASLVFSFEAVGRDVMSGTALTALILAGLGCGWGYWWHARRVAHPILDLSLLSIPTFSVAVLGGNLCRLAVGAVPFLLAMQLQVVFGLTPLASGMLTFASAIGALAMKVSSTWVIRMFGFRRALLYNTMTTSASIICCVAFTPATPHVVILFVLLTAGFFRSLQLTAVNALVYADIGPEQMGRATGIASAVQQLAISMGVAISAFTLKSSMALRGSDTLNATDVNWGFIVVGLAMLWAALWFRRLSAHAGAEVSGNRHRRTGA